MNLLLIEFLNIINLISVLTIPGGSEVKASACNMGDLGLIPGSGRSPGEGKGILLHIYMGFPSGTSGNGTICQCRTHKRSRLWVQSMGQENPLEEGMATPSSILAWRIPWTEEPGELQSMGSQRDGHN